MLHYLAVKCTDILKEKDVIQNEKEKIYIYGFELLGSFVLSIVSILIWSSILGYCDAVLVFLLFFIPIRITAGGYHAKTYGSCFFWTNFIALGSVLLSLQLWKMFNNKLDIMMWMLFVIALLYIWKNAPVVSKKFPLRPEIVLRNQRYARMILVAEVIVLLGIKVWLGGSLVYVAIFATYIVAIMIGISKKGET